MVLPPIYKIHPAIGITRLGNASTFFIGPEIPGMRPTGDPPGTKVPPYKDGGKIKPQAARFRIFEYVDKGGNYVASREITLNEKDVTKLIWTVHLANRKASFFNFDGLEGGDRPHPVGDLRNKSVIDRRKLEIDPKERSISGKNAKPVPFSKGTSLNPGSELWPDPKPSPEITTLGKLLTDSEGRLLVLGGSGISVKLAASSPIGDYANNDGWFDDVSDGPVTVQLKLKSKAVNVSPAWVICAPPDFAPHLTNVVSLYDILYDLVAGDKKIVIPTNEALYKTGSLKNLAAIKKEFAAAGKKELSSYTPDFATEIYPILFRTYLMMFVFTKAVGRHSTFITSKELASKDPKHDQVRQSVFDMLREPDAMPTQNWPIMPKLLGDEPYPISGVIHKRVRFTLTHTQYTLLKQWSKGKFIESSAGTPPKPIITPITPDGLDRAALENCAGGGFFPGIEVGWQIRSASIYAEPFRIKHAAPSPYIGDVGIVVRAGHFTRQMALPWQADFLQCKAEEDGSGAFPGFGLWGWWPGQRPDGVFASEADFLASSPKSVPWHRATKAKKKIVWPIGMIDDTGARVPDVPSYDEMLNNWTRYGFVLEKKKNLFLEDEREDNIPP